MSQTIAIPRKLTRGSELIVIDRREYEDLKRHLAEVRSALEKIRRGENELRRGKTIVTTHSLAGLRRK